MRPIKPKEHLDVVDRVNRFAPGRESQLAMPILNKAHNQNGGGQAFDYVSKNVEHGKPSSQNVKPLINLQSSIENLSLSQNSVPKPPAPVVVRRPKPRINMEIIPNNARVVITCVLDYKTLAIRSLTCNKEYIQLLKDICDWSIKEIETIKMDSISCGDIILAPSTEFGPYCRANVLSIENGRCAVEFIDFGGRETVQLNQIKQLSQDLQTRKVFLNKMTLRDVGEACDFVQKKAKDYLAALHNTKTEFEFHYNAIDCKTDSIGGDLVFPTDKRSICEHINEWSKLYLAEAEKAAKKEEGPAVKEKSTSKSNDEIKVSFSFAGA